MEVYGEYRASVARIRETVAESHHQMDHVHRSLASFQSGLLGVEREMLPIYKLTERLRDTQKNIDLCVQELRRVNQHFVAAQELAPMLLSGAKFDQDEYVAALQQLLVAISFMESHRSYDGSGKALEQAKDLLGQARKKCKTDFVNAVGVLSRGSRNEHGRVVWSRPTPRDVAKVTQLLRCLVSSDVDQEDLLSKYGKQRFQVAKQFLCATPGSDSVQFVAHESIAELSRRMDDIQTTIQAEKQVAELVFQGEELYHRAFRHAALPVFDSMKRDLDASLASVASSKQSTVDPFKLVLLHDLLRGRMADLDVTLQPPLLLRDREGKGFEDPWVLSKLTASIVSGVAAVAKQKLLGFQLGLTENISVGDRSLAKDGNVHPASSHMLNFVRRLCELNAPLSGLFAKESHLTPISFIGTAVMQLIETLQAKCAQFKGRSDLRQLFLVNNFGFIAASLPHCSDPEIESYITSNIKCKIEGLRDNAVAQFIDTSYRPFECILSEPTEKLVYTKGSSVLTLESGRLLKDRFTRFNTLLEDIHTSQQHFIISEPLIRHQIVHTAIDIIIPRYTAFHSKYSVIQFSKKNSSKYLKYIPSAVEQLLGELFLGEISGPDKHKK